MGSYKTTYVGPYLMFKHIEVTDVKEVYKTKSGKELKKFTKFCPETGEEVFIIETPIKRKIGTPAQWNKSDTLWNRLSYIDYIEKVKDFSIFIPNQKGYGICVDNNELYEIDINDLSTSLSKFTDDYKDIIELFSSESEVQIGLGIVNY